MIKSKKRVALKPALLLLTALFCVQSAAAQEGWWIGRANQGPDLSAIYSYSSGSEKVFTAEHVWVGDDAGALGVIANPEEKAFFKLNTTQIGVAAAKGKAKPPSSPINDIFFLDPAYGFVLKGNTIYTNRGGAGAWATFLSVPPKKGAAATLYSISFFPKNPRRGCVVGVYSRNDVVEDNLVLCGNLPEGLAVADWRPPTVVDAGQNELYNLALVDDKYGWIVGSEGTILKTSDAGATWRAQKSGVPGSLFHADFMSRDKGVAVGEHAIVLRTEDGGEHWTIIPTPIVTDVSLLSVKFTEKKNRGWAVGRKGVILYTDNGGKRWTSINDKNRAEDLYALFIDRRYCWIAGAKGLIMRYTLDPEKED